VQNGMDRTAGTGVRTGLLVQDCQDKKDRTGWSERESRGRTGRWESLLQDSKREWYRAGQPGQLKEKTGRPENDSMDRAATTGQLGQESWHRTATTGHPEQDSQDMSS
jgi:hypothetical protein